MPIVDSANRMISSQQDILRLANWSTVAAGQTASIQLPRNWTYMTLFIELIKVDGTTRLTDAEIATALTEVRILINGVPQYRMSAAMQQMLNAFYLTGTAKNALTADQGSLVIPLARPWMLDIDGQDQPGWGGLGLNSLALEFDQAGGGLATSAVLWAEVGPAAPLGRFIAQYQYNLNALGSGQSPIFNILPQDATQSLYAVHINKTTITDMSILPDGRTPLWDRVNFIQYKQMLRKYGLTPAAATWSNFAFVRRGRHSDALPLGDPNFQILPTFSAGPGATTMIAEIALNG